jgi:hypothetical protein
MEVSYTATEKFTPTSRRTYQGRDMPWQGYIAWSKLTHVKEIVTLDGILGKRVVKRDNELDADFLVWGDYIPDLYNNLPYLLSKLQALDPSGYNLLAVIKEPAAPCETTPLEGFDFIGYDLLDAYGGISALTNCGGFSNTFLPQDLNQYGLISAYDMARTTKKNLLMNNPDEHHANCNVWAIWRMR